MTLEFMSNGDIINIFDKKIDMLNEIRIYNTLAHINNHLTITPLFTFYMDVNYIKYNTSGYKSIRSAVKITPLLELLVSSIFDFINILQYINFTHSNLSVDTLFVKQINDNFEFILIDLSNSYINDTCYISPLNYYNIYKSLLQISYDNPQLTTVIKKINIRKYYKNDFI